MYVAISGSISASYAIIAVELELDKFALFMLAIVLFASSMLILNYFRPHISKDFRVPTILLCACLIGLFLAAIV